GMRSAYPEFQPRKAGRRGSADIIFERTSMDLVAQSAFGEVAALLVLAAGVGFIGILLRQPLIVSFIAVGLIAGPTGLNVVASDEQIALLSQLGIAVLIFLVGIKLDVKLIRSLGAVSLMTGLG